VKIEAAVSQGPEKELKIETVDLASPKSDEVLIEIKATRICHTDLVARDTTDHLSQNAVLGHEGAGVVKEIGEDVTYVEAGDHVVMTALACGECESCMTGHPGTCENHMELNFRGTSLDNEYRHRKDDEDLNMFFGQSSFATHSTGAEFLSDGGILV